MGFPIESVSAPLGSILQQPGRAVIITPTHKAEPAGPKVSVPKVVDIQYDPAQAKKSLQAAVSMLNQQMDAKKQGLGFSYDDATNQPVITVRNTSSGEVIRQIPTEDLLRIAHKMDDLKGILYNKIT
jgi:flagellar protein FlaG